MTLSGINDRITRPSQARSRITFDRILSVAKEIIVEQGIAALNTNLVAERAGINIGTVYHYFPDKIAILLELSKADRDLRSSYIIDKVSELPSAPDLENWVHEVVELTYRLRKDHPATVELRRAIRSIPELLDADRIRNEEVVTRLNTLYTVRFPNASPARRKMVARVNYETLTGLLDAYGDDITHDKSFYTEVASMIVAHMKTLEN
jgi:AcrR family transcriptional regulator